MTSRYPTCIDLARFVAEHPGNPADPFGAGRVLLPLGPAPVEIASVGLAAGTGGSAVAAGDLFVVALSGSVTLAAAGSTVRLGPGASGVITAGTAFDWTAPGGAALVTMAYPAASGAPAGVIAIAQDAELAPSGPPLAELLVGETPACRNHTTFRSADGVFTCGVWDSTPYHRRAMRYGHFEMMILLRGSVTFVDEGDSTFRFGAGDVFLVELDARCSWESREDVAKVYAIYRPLA